MHGELKRAFKLAFQQGLVKLGYTLNANTVFARELFPGVFGCIGYITSESLSGVRPFVGVQFERVEAIDEELMKPFRVFGKNGRYSPSLFRDLYSLKEERSADPDFRLKESQYLRIELGTVSSVCDHILIDVRQYGLPYIEFNATLTSAAATMAEGRGGGLGTVAYRLPIIYWILGRSDEAKAYMTSTAAKGAPIGPYEKYAALLTARMDAGPAPLPPNLH